MKRNFGEILRQRWENASFSVDPDDRKAMEEMLTGKKRRGGILYWWLGGMAVVLLTGFFIWQSLHTPAHPVIHQPSEENVPAKDAMAVGKDMLHQENDQVVPSNRDVPASEKAVSAINSNDRQTEVTKASSKNNSKSQTTPKSGLKTEKINSHRKSSSEPSANSGQKVVSTPNNLGQEKLENEQEQQQHYLIDTKDLHKADVVSDPVGVKVYPDSVQYDPWTGIIYDDRYWNSQLTSPIPGLMAEEAEAPVITTNSFAPEKIMVRHPHPVFVYAEAGAGYVPAKGHDISAGKKFFAGGGVGVSLAPRLKLFGGAGYQLQDGGFRFERMSTVNTLGFGLRSQFNSLKPDKLHSIYGQLGLSYKVNRHVFTGNVGMQWLYGAQGEINVYAVDQLDGTSEQSQYTWVKTDGLSSNRWTSGISYGYMLFPGMTVNAGAQFYLTPFLAKDADLAQDGYYWDGASSSCQPFVSLKYVLYEFH